MAMSPKQKLAAAMTRVTDSANGWAPYFGVMLRGLIRCEMDPSMCEAMIAMGSKPTMAVTADGILYWAASFADSCSTEELAFALMHETMHVLTKFFERAAALGIVPAPTADAASKAFIANLADDACVNESLAKMCPVPASCVTPDKLQQAPNLIFEERYRLLLERAQKECASGDGNGDESGKGKKGATGPGQAGNGWCGGCAGHPVPGEPQSGKSPEGRSAAQMDRYRRETAEQIKDAMTHQKLRGTVPDSLVRWAEEQLQPAKIDWRKRLAQAVRAAVAYRPGAVDLTYNRMSRRQFGLGVGVGRPIVPSYRAPVPRVSCLLDTSGSMSKDDLTAAVAEVQGVLHAVGASVTFCVCDAAVHGVADIATAQAAISMLVGGGGTDMRPGMQELQDRTPGCEILILFTDGHIGDGYLMPEPAYKVVWVVLGKGGNEHPCPYGEVIVVDEDGAREAT